MRVYLFSSSSYNVLADGSDRSVGKRCGPYGFSAPIYNSAAKEACIDAEYMEPESRSNKWTRVSFSVSVEFATEAEAQAFANVGAKSLPESGDLLVIDELTSTMQRYENAVWTEISPVQNGVSVDVHYAFDCGRQTDMGFTLPAPVIQAVIANVLSVWILWESAVGATKYQVWAKIAGSMSDPVLLESEIQDTSWMHVSGDTVNRTYYIRAANAVFQSPLSTGMNGAGRGS